MRIALSIWAGRLCALAATACVLALGLAAAGAPISVAGGGEVVQPKQPKSGPGGRNLPHEDMRVSEGGSGNEAFYVFEPTGPKPKRAPLAVIMHGYYEFDGYESLEGLIRHTVRSGAVVIYPRWQTGVSDPCPGPFNIEPCMESALAGIQGGLDFLRSDPSRVQPQVGKASYFGFSFGGIITANLANRYEALGLPRPRAIFLDDPHDGGLVGNDEPALDDSLDGIPSDVLIQCHSGASGVIGEAGKAESSCNSLFPKLDGISTRNKDLVLTRDDDHGTPALSSAHGVCAGSSRTADDSGFILDAYDWKFCWKVWDALRTSALTGKRSPKALGDTREHRSNGRWSDGRAVARLKITDAAPIGPP